MNKSRSHQLICHQQINRDRVIYNKGCVCVYLDPKLDFFTVKVNNCITYIQRALGRMILNFVIAIHKKINAEINIQTSCNKMFRAISIQGG